MVNAINFFKKNGFTLIELIVVTGILLIVGGISSGLLFSILKGSFKAAVIKETKQNGEYALSVMERAIRNAVSVTPCENGVPSDYLTVTKGDGSTIEFSFSSDNIASSGANLISEGFKVSSYKFECESEGGKPIQVKIEFTLEKSLTNIRAEEKTAISFQTKVRLRNY